MSETYQFPFRGSYRLGALFGQKGKTWACGWHSGLDLFSHSAGGDGLVHPVAAGNVVGIKVHGASYGNDVVVQHADGYLSLYAHLKRIDVEEGQRVGLDSFLGVEGTTGNSSGVHLHLEIHKGTYFYPASIDPLKFLEERVEDVMIVPRYEKLKDIPEKEFRDVVEKLMNKGIIKGDGSDKTGNDDVIDLSRDMVRMFVMNFRAGIYGN